MKLSIFWIMVSSLICSSSALAWWDDCDYEDHFSNSIAVDGAAVIEVYALSGSLRIIGESGRDRVDGAGDGCAEEESQIKNMAIQMTREGDRIRIVTLIPPPRPNSEWLNASINLELDVPDDVPLVVSDSSGDIEIVNIAALQISDSSGEIDIRQVKGEIVIQRDSSGNIDIHDSGAVVIRVDSSGDIDIDSADSVTIDDDTSGNIFAANIEGDVAIGTDTSGSISVRRVSGSFTVGSDTSGGIRHRDVEGEISLPHGSHDD